jgi:uncharacterized phage-associated protein
MSIKALRVTIVDKVLEKYGPLTAIRLEQLTPREDPWLKARAGLARPMNRPTQ